MWKFRRILHPQAALVRVSVVAAVAISIVLPVRQKPPTVAGHFIIFLDIYSVLHPQLDYLRAGSLKPDLEYARYI